MEAVFSLLKIINSIMVNFQTGSKMGMARFNGLTAHLMKAAGLTMNSTIRAYSNILMALSIKELGLMDKSTD